MCWIFSALLVLGAGDQKITRFRVGTPTYVSNSNFRKVKLCTYLLFRKAGHLHYFDKAGRTQDNHLKSRTFHAKYGRLKTLWMMLMSEPSWYGQHLKVKTSI